MNSSEPTTSPTTITHSLYVAALALTSLTAGLAIIAWGQNMDWQLGHLSMYQLFPLLGLLAFSIMWSQYVMEAIKNYLGHGTAITSYFQYTSTVVLVLILLHPGLLIAQRFHDGYGLPPGSYESYVAPAQKWITILGSLSLLMFLAFELKRWFGDKPWWKYVLLLNDVAIVAIFYHGLRLGQDIGHSWYQGLWYVYGVVLVAVLVYKYYRKLESWRTAST
jgi:hypothetical protein